jgi:hypothetical protein
MNIGVILPQVEIGQDPSAIAEYAQHVRALEQPRKDALS